jgi:hypothetical protein
MSSMNDTGVVAGHTTDSAGSPPPSPPSSCYTSSPRR